MSGNMALGGRDGMKILCVLTFPLVQIVQMISHALPTVDITIFIIPNEKKKREKETKS